RSRPMRRTCPSQKSNDKRNQGEPAMMRYLLSLGAVFACVALALPADDKKDDEKGWVQLFNGKDLTGWETHPKDKAKWEVKDGMIIGTGGVGHLYSKRDDYENFRYRI